jgi:transposase-like protein
MNAQILRVAQQICGSEHYRKNGSYQGVQRYLCKTCGRSCTSRGQRFDRKVKEEALEMYLNNVGIRKIARFVQASPTAVIHWIRADCRNSCIRWRRRWKASCRTSSRGMKSYPFVKKNSSGPGSGLLIVGGKAVLLPMKSAKG